MPSRIIIYKEYLLKNLPNEFGTLIFLDPKEDIFPHIFQILSKRKPLSTIIVTNEKNFLEFRDKLSTFQENTRFFLSTYEADNYLIWRQIITINGLNNVVINQLEFKRNGTYEDRINLQGKGCDSSSD